MEGWYRTRNSDTGKRKGGEKEECKSVNTKELIFPQNLNAGNFINTVLPRMGFHDQRNKLTQPVRVQKWEEMIGKPNYKH